MVEGNPRPFVLFLWDGDNRKQLVDRSRKRTASDPDPEHGHLSMRDAAHHENTGRFTDLRDYCATATPPPTHAKRGGQLWAPNTHHKTAPAQGRSAELWERQGAIPFYALFGEAPAAVCAWEVSSSRRRRINRSIATGVGRTFQRSVTRRASLPLKRTAKAEMVL